MLRNVKRPRAMCPPVGQWINGWLRERNALTSKVLGETASRMPGVDWDEIDRSGLAEAKAVHVLGEMVTCNPLWTPMLQPLPASVAAVAVLIAPLLASDHPCECRTMRFRGKRL
tara:strand:+ start:162 stop:503 length:342 start_codon:yes stop_codon:yes gene_type:complete